MIVKFIRNVASIRTLLHRDYTACARLIGSVGFDEGISAEEFRLLKMTLFSTMKAAWQMWPMDPGIRKKHPPNNSHLTSATKASIYRNGQRELESWDDIDDFHVMMKTKCRKYTT